ncbi:hypothetical protein ACHQM5_008903 [Ranunculus cassubicifolius]
MAAFTLHHMLTLIFGILGNIFSVLVYLAPLPTFYRIYKKRSTEGFQSTPYVFALLSGVTWIYYAFLKSGAFLLITINAFGCVIETIYIVLFIVFAARKAMVLATMLLFVAMGVFSLIVLLTLFLAKGEHRVYILGWISVAISTSVFASPFGIMRLVIQTKSVEFMPFSLSLFLTLSAIMWFSYGMVLKDYFIAVPNVVGFIFGVIQMGLYVMYKNKNRITREKLPEQTADIIELDTKEIPEVHPVDEIEHNSESEKHVYSSDREETTHTDV